MTILGENMRSMEGYGASFEMFDQLNPDPEFISANFNSDVWAPVVDDMKEADIARIIPASESGVRNLAVELFANTVGIDILTIPGSDRELTWKQYLSLNHRSPDLIEYQGLVAWSKHNRLRKTPQAELERLGVFSDDKIESKTLAIAFDTIILVWDGGRYVRYEKPESDVEAVETIKTLSSGAPFLVSTVSRVQNMMNSAEVAMAATLLPVRVVTGDRFDRAELESEWIRLYRSIASGGDRPWRVTPAGPSLMHPMIQPFIEVGVSDGLEGNVLPNSFSTYGYVDNPGVIHKPQRFENIGPLAYKQFAEEIVSEGGYDSLGNMTPEDREIVGMIFSGYSDVGFRVALERYLIKAGTVGYSPLTRLRDQKMSDLLET